MKAVVLYWSKTGNTKKIAQTIKEAIEESDIDTALQVIDGAVDLDWFDYDLVCLGFPSHQWHPPEDVVNYLKKRSQIYRKKDMIKIGAPKIPGKYALIFCSYSGPHTGIDEAIPAGKYAGQFFAHLGFSVEECYVIGEFHGSAEKSTQGPLGDICGRPDEDDLAKVKNQVFDLISKLRK